MRAIVVTAIGGSEVLELQDVPPPVAEPGALVVQVEAAGVNYPRHLRAQRHLPDRAAVHRRRRGRRHACSRSARA